MQQSTPCTGTWIDILQTEKKISYLVKSRCMATLLDQCLLFWRSLHFLFSSVSNFCSFFKTRRRKVTPTEEASIAVKAVYFSFLWKCKLLHFFKLSSAKEKNKSEQLLDSFKAEMKIKEDIYLYNVLRRCVNILVNSRNKRTKQFSQLCLAMWFNSYALYVNYHS